MPIKDYSTDPDLNVQISGINIAEGCPPSGINNAIRQLMADVKEESEAKAEAITAAGEALEAFAEEQAAKDDEQDAAIAEAQVTADAAQSSADAAQSSADAAQSSADAAQSSADAAQSSADAANQGLVGVVRSVNGVSADAAGNVNYAEISKGNNGYVKFSNGFILQWGGVTMSSNKATVTLPTAFSNGAIRVMLTVNTTNYINSMPVVTTRSTTSFTIKQESSGGTIMWIAAGY